MKEVACFVFGLMIFISTRAQDITRIEYFFDTDPGFGSGIPVIFTPDSLVSTAFTVNVSGIPAGLHMFCMRAGNAVNVWSVVSNRLFAVFDYAGSQNIVQMEYFVDNDPGFGSGSQVSITQGSQVSKQFTIDLTGVGPGIHILVVRCRNILNQWSLTGHYSFLYAATSFEDIANLEYYIDYDPGYGNGHTILVTPGKNITKSFVIDLTGVLPGIHKLITRCRNSAGQWSQVGHYLFNAVDPEIGDIRQIEYFFDADPGFGNGKPVTVVPGTDISKTFSPDLTGLSDGIHLMWLRSKNLYNRWSSPAKTLFLKEDTVIHLVAKLEYYFTKDPGYGNGKNVPVIPARELTSNFILDTNDVSAGNYFLVTRVKNNAARWSIISSKPIVVRTKTWTGLIDDDWKVPGNWEPAGVPLSTDKVIIPAATPWMPVVRESGHSCHDVSVAAGATLTLLTGITLELTGDMKIE
jgi:hypothetical protein